MMLAARFKNPEWEASFNEKGYVHVPGFLSPEVVGQLLALYKKHHVSVNPEAMMWNSLYDVGPKTGLEISDTIKAAVNDVLEATFEAWKFPVATFMSKNPIEKSVCELHRDYTVFDEDRFQFRNIWIPLVDITTENGALCVVPKSHRLFADIRPMFMEWPYKHLEPELNKYCEVLCAKAGDLVVYADRTLHGSLNNDTHDPRPVIHGGILHHDAELQYYRLLEKTLNIYRVSYDFYFSGNFNSPDLGSQYPLVQTRSYEPLHITVDDLQALGR